MFRRNFTRYTGVGAKFSEWLGGIQRAAHEKSAADADLLLKKYEVRSVAELTEENPALRENVRSTCPRSALFVPGSNAKALRKAAQTLNPDVIVLDLEDSVALDKKQLARETIVEMLLDGHFKGKRIVIRINSPRLLPEIGFPDLDAAGLVSPFIEAIAVPKTSLADYALMEDHLHPKLNLWAFFETPQSILEAREICASGKYQVAVMGTNDLSADLQLPTSVPRQKAPAMERRGVNEESATYEASSVYRHCPRLPLHYHLSTVVTAARAYGMHTLDGVYNETTDPTGLRLEALEGKRMGFSGKTLIHPSQIEVCHEVFSPDADEILWAEKVVHAAEQKRIQDQENGLKSNTLGIGGVATVDGRMVEQMHLTHAQRVLQRKALYQKESARAGQEEAASDIGDEPAPSTPEKKVRTGKAVRRKPKQFDEQVPPLHEMDQEGWDPTKTQLPGAWTQLGTVPEHKPKPPGAEKE